MITEVTIPVLISDSEAIIRLFCKLLTIKLLLLNYQLRVTHSYLFLIKF